MTRSDLTLIAMLVDHSGSMAQCREDMEGGLNTFIETQRCQPGSLDLAMAEFDDDFDIVRPMGRLGTAYRYELRPRGMTALHDAMARYITEIGAQLKDLPEGQRPARVIMVIVTDGKENASTEYRAEAGRAQIRDMVKRQRDEFAWEFVFLGADIDAPLVGEGLGMSRGSSMTYDKMNPRAVYDSFASVSANISDYRIGAASSTNFTEEDRDKAMGKTPSTPGT
jgi:uncharacterized protein YegL